MTDEKLEKALDLKDSMKALRDIRRAFCATYPEVCIRDPGESYVSFYNLDKTTQEELKKLIRDYIDSRFEEIEKEYEEL